MSGATTYMTPKSLGGKVSNPEVGKRKNSKTSDLRFGGGSYWEGDTTKIKGGWSAVQRPFFRASRRRGKRNGVLQKKQGFV